jgi:hypothetical protein
MPIISNENKAVISFKAMIVILIAIVLFLSIPAYSAYYLCLGTLCLAVGGTAICSWLLIVGKTHTYVKIILGICLAIGVLAYFLGVPSEWRTLTGQNKQISSSQQEIHTTTLPLTFQLTETISLPNHP